jgi:hypothetical protein
MYGTLARVMCPGNSSHDLWFAFCAVFLFFAGIVSRGGSIPSTLCLLEHYIQHVNCIDLLIQVCASAEHKTPKVERDPHAGAHNTADDAL